MEQMLCSVLKDVTLGADGNIVATYMDAANGGALNGLHLLLIWLNMW